MYNSLSIHFMLHDGVSAFQLNTDLLASRQLTEWLHANQRVYRS